MDSVELLEAPAAASSPSHPQHARWVKQAMVQREVDWLRRLGIAPNARLVDQRINEGMRRLEARKRERQSPAPAPAPAPRQADHNAAHELARDAGYEFTKTAARPRPRPIAPYYACRRCGRCRRCRRELRAMNILRAARAGDEKCLPLAHRLIAVSMRAQASAGEFTGLPPHDVNRALTRIIEDICDQSVAIAGAWR